MSHITLTTRNGDTRELSLPLHAEEFMAGSVSYYLAYGQAKAHFDTPDKELNEALTDRLPEEVEGGVKELSLLAYILDRKDAEWLAQLRDNLPESPGSIGELVQSAYSSFEWDHLMERYTRKLNQDIESQRMTGGELFDHVMQCARENGDLANFDDICDYVLPDDRHKEKLCSYEFDMLPIVNFGGSEGIYIDCGLRGKFDESGRDSISIGTIKTLSADLDACKIMGELCGVLMYHESKYVNEHLTLFDSSESIERMLTKPLLLEQTQAEALQMSGQQM
jgi:hypothetical protein